MGSIENINQRVKKLTFFDIQLIKCANIFFALFLAKLIPELLKFNTSLFLFLCILCSIKPFYVAWIKDE